MGARAQQQVLRLCAAALAALLCAGSAGAVTLQGTDEATPPPAPPSAEVSARAVAALRDMAAAYGNKRRMLFMKYVSDDYTGDLGTLEDALSSDFRAYRTINLAIVPNQTTVKDAKTQVQFRFDLTVTNDSGQTQKFAGQALYTFVDENGKARLLQMDRVPIFGTSLSSVENPIPKSQGAPTQVVSGANSVPNSCATPVSGSAVLDAETHPGFDFATQTLGSFGSGDISFAGGNTVLANGSAGLSNQGPCDLATFSQDPASIMETSDTPNVGDCVAVKTKAGKFAVFKVISFPPSAMSIQFKFQASGASCF